MHWWSLRFATTMIRTRFFCLNALFIRSQYILNFGLERNGDGNVSIPKGGLFVMLSDKLEEGDIRLLHVTNEAGVLEG